MTFSLLLRGFPLAIGLSFSNACFADTQKVCSDVGADVQLASQSGYQNGHLVWKIDYHLTKGPRWPSLATTTPIRVWLKVLQADGTDHTHYLDLFARPGRFQDIQEQSGGWGHITGVAVTNVTCVLD